MKQFKLFATIILFMVGGQVALAAEKTHYECSVHDTLNNQSYLINLEGLEERNRILLGETEIKIYSYPSTNFGLSISEAGQKIAQTTVEDGQDLNLSLYIKNLNIFCFFRNFVL